MARPAGTSSPPRRDAARRKQWKDLWREHKGLREASMPDEMFFGNFPHGRAAMGVNVKAVIRRPLLGYGIGSRA